MEKLRTYWRWTVWPGIDQPAFTEDVEPVVAVEFSRLEMTRPWARACVGVISAKRSTRASNRSQSDPE